MIDTELQQALADLRTTTRGTFAFCVHDLDTGTQALVDAGESFAAASVIKLPIMLKLLEMVATGAVSLDQTAPLTEWQKTGGSGIFQHFQEGTQFALGDACTAMIAISDNTATNMLLDVTGIAPVNELLVRMGCARTRLHRYIGKPEMAGPPGPSQAAPLEVGHLLELLARRAILTPPLCETAITMLRRQTIRTVIPRLLPERTPVAHKTGSLDGIRHDAGIIWRPDPVAPPEEPAGAMARRTGGSAAGHPIVFVGMSKDADMRWTVDNEAEVLIARAARLAFDRFSAER